MLLKKEEIKETEEELKYEMNKETHTRKKERLLFLYIIKSNQARVMTKVSKIVGKDRATTREWALKYKKGGKEELLKR
jgi:iron-sulfur cluster repair protein YtfE (RIC family)